MRFLAIFRGTPLRHALCYSLPSVLRSRLLPVRLWSVLLFSSVLQGDGEWGRRQPSPVELTSFSLQPSPYMADRHGRKPLTVTEVTAEAVKQGRDHFDDCTSYDDFMRRFLVKVDNSHQFLGDEVREALEEDRRTMDDVAEEIMEADDA